MTRNIPPLGRAVLYGLALAGLLALPPCGAARASAITTTIPFNEALTWSYNPDASGLGDSSGNTCCDYVNIVNSGPPTPASTVYQQSGAWGSVYGSASADLATGQLKMQTAATYGDGSASPAIQANAIFGDGFRTTTTSGAPFVWTSASRAAFTISLDGTMSASRPLNSDFNPSLFVILSILSPNTLDPAQPLINGSTAQQYFFWDIGNPDTTIYYTDQNHNSQALTPTAQYGSIPSTLTAEFNVGGDFDWVLLLGSSGQLTFGDPSDPMTAGDYFDFDLSHTLTMNYSGPQGSVTTPESGQFRNFGAPLPDATVPEPGSLAVLLSALLSFALLRARG